MAWVLIEWGVLNVLESWILKLLFYFIYLFIFFQLLFFHEIFLNFLDSIILAMINSCPLILLNIGQPNISIHKMIHLFKRIHLLTVFDLMVHPITLIILIWLLFFNSVLVKVFFVHCNKVVLDWIPLTIIPRSHAFGVYLFMVWNLLAL